MRLSDLLPPFLLLTTITTSHAFVMSPSSAFARPPASPLWLVPSKTEASAAVATTTRRRQRERLLATKPFLDKADQPGLWDKVVRIFSQSANTKRASPAAIRSDEDRKRVQLLTLLRVGIPSVLAGIAAYLVFPVAALTLAGSMHDPGVFSVLAQDSSQFVQNFLTVAGLLFSILVGQTCE